MFRRELPLSVLLRLPEDKGCYCCLYVPSAENPIGAVPSRAWTEISEGDRVVIDGTAYAVERVVPLERPGQYDPALAELRRREGREKLLALAATAH